MESKIVISFAKETDVPKISRISEETYRQIQNPDWYYRDDEETIRKHISEEGFILKAEIEGEIAGFLMVRYPKEAADNLGVYLNLTGREKERVAHMETAAVRREYRGNRIQYRLMTEGEKIAVQQGYQYLMGTAHPDNTYSVNNFKKLGYDILAEDLKYGGLPRYIFCRRMQEREE